MLLSERVIRLQNGIVALLISAERSRALLAREKAARLSESSNGESCGEESDCATTDGTSEDCATSEDGDHVTSEDDTDASCKAHGGRDKKCQDQSIMVSVLFHIPPHTCTKLAVTASCFFFGHGGHAGSVCGLRWCG